jgi:preprotein translocase subunit SecG
MNDQNQSQEQTQNAPAKKPFYKKWWVMVILFIFIIIVIGNSSDNKKTEPMAEAPVPTKNPEEIINTNQNKPVEIKNEESKNSQTDTIIDIRSIVNKTPEEVVSILGEAEKSEKVKPSGTACVSTSCDEKTFQSGKYEIVFINNKADWVTINLDSTQELKENSIKLIGLPETKPSLNNKSILTRWENIENIKEISFFDNGSGKIEYIYIKANSN